MPATCPLEALFQDDASSLSNADLLYVLLADREDVQAVMTAYPTLTELEAAHPEELADLPLIDRVPLSRLLAARELHQRLAREKVRRGSPIMSAKDTFQMLEPLLRTETREVVLALALDTKSRLLCPPITVAIGTVSSVPLHPREVFRPLIRVAACMCVIAHLHPNSGEPVPSPNDIEVTARLKEASELLGIPLMDHVVIGRSTYLSMAERGLL